MEFLHRLVSTSSNMCRTCHCILLLLLCLTVSGCWDLRELQDRNFVIAAAIDAGDAGKKPAQGPAVTKVETFVQEQGDKEYRLSLQVLKLNAPSSQSDKSPEAAKTFVISNTGNSMFEMARDMLGQSSKALYYEHINAIVISEAAVRQHGLAHILDFFRRDSEMRWRIKVFITPGEARPIIEYVPPSGEPGGRYLSGMTANHKKSNHLATARTDLGNISQSLDNQADVLIPRLEMADNVVKAGGLAVFKHDQFVAYVDEYIARGVKIIAGTEKSLVIPVECRQHPGNMLVFELFHHDTVLTPHIDGNNIYFTLDIVMEGNLGEVTCSLLHNTQDYSYLQTVEQYFAEEVKKNCETTFAELQRLGVDPLRFGQMIKGDYPYVWEQIKDNWDDIYPTIPINVSVKVKIRNIGEHK